MKNYSVLMSVYYKENPEYLRQSIQSMLEQTVLTDDFVLVCDGPLTKELDEVVDEFVFKYPGFFHVLRLKKNVGLGKALNEGLHKCKNKLVARMDSDDIAYPDRCERQLEVFRNHSVDIVSGTVEEFSDDISYITAKRELPQTHDEIVRFARLRCPFNHPCVMYKKSAVERAGGYQHFYLFEDYYLWVRMLQSGAKGYNIPEPLLYMRAGHDMYNRCGGVKYVKSMLKFRNYMRKVKFTGNTMFVFSSLGHSLTSIVPNSYRRKIYKSLLRK